MALLRAQPIVFETQFEQPEPDEAETFAEIRAVMRSIIEVTNKDYGHAMRAVHAKSHGLLQGEIEVLNNLPAHLSQGIFSKPRKYPVVMRFSTIPGDILDDSISTTRGLAVKIIGVEGDRLPGSEHHVTQDFVMQNAPAFSVRTPKDFLGKLRLRAKTTDTPQFLKKGLSKRYRSRPGSVWPTERLHQILGRSSEHAHSRGHVLHDGAAPVRSLLL
jgi:Catalase